MTSQKPQNPVKTAQTTIHVVEALRTLNGATVTALANHLRISKSSTHNYLQTLEHEGHVTTDGQRYRVSIRFLDLGAHARLLRHQAGSPGLAMRPESTSISLSKSTDTAVSSTATASAKP